MLARSVVLWLWEEASDWGCGDAASHRAPRTGLSQKEYSNLLGEATTCLSQSNKRNNQPLGSPLFPGRHCAIFESHYQETSMGSALIPPSQPFKGQASPVGDLHLILLLSLAPAGSISALRGLLRIR